MNQINASKNKTKNKDFKTFKIYKSSKSTYLGLGSTDEDIGQTSVYYSVRILVVIVRRFGNFSRVTTKALDVALAARFEIVV